jgi:Trk-type K+ transport system membrane component
MSVTIAASATFFQLMRSCLDAEFQQSTSLSLKSNPSKRRLAMHLKIRLFALILILVCAGLVYYNWHQLTVDHVYSFTLASFGPVGVVGGLFLLLFPTKAGKPETTGDKILVLVVLVIGLAAGLVNWYLMDPGFFGR